MLESLMYSVNSVAPIFLLVIFGMVLKRIGFLNQDYCTIADKIVFNIALPTECFMSLAKSDITDAFSKDNIKILLFFVIGILTVFTLLCLTVPFFIKDKAKIGAFIQGVFRGNYALFAIPLIDNMFGEAGKLSATAILPAVVIVFNILSVVVFNIFYPDENMEKTKISALVLKMVKSVIRNPLVIGVVLGTVVSFFKTLTSIGLPVFAAGTLQKIASMAVPLALISIGVNFKSEKLKSGLAKASVAMALKNVIMPAIAVTVAVLMGIRGILLTVVLIAFGSPTSVSSYVMAKNMHGDHELAGQILLLTTVCSLFTIFMFIFLLKYFAFI